MILKQTLAAYLRVVVRNHNTVRSRCKQENQLENKYKLYTAQLMKKYLQILKLLMICYSMPDQILIIFATSPYHTFTHINTYTYSAIVRALSYPHLGTLFVYRCVLLWISIFCLYWQFIIYTEADVRPLLSTGPKQRPISRLQYFHQGTVQCKSQHNSKLQKNR